MNNKLSFFGLILTKNLLVLFLLKRKQFLSLIHQSTCHSLDHHVMNGQSTLRISTVTEAQNYPILGMLFLPLFLYVLNQSPLWYLVFLEEIIVVLIRMSILSLPHSYDQLDIISYA